MNFTDYLSTQPEAFRPVLIKIRNYLAERVPFQEEQWAEGFMVFIYKYRLVGYGVVFDKPCIYFLKSHFFKKYEDAFKGYESNGTTLYILPGQEIPPIVDQIIAERIAENDALFLEEQKKEKI